MEASQSKAHSSSHLLAVYFILYIADYPTIADSKTEVLYSPASVSVAGWNASCAAFTGPAFATLASPATALATFASVTDAPGSDALGIGAGLIAGFGTAFW